MPTFISAASPVRVSPTQINLTVKFAEWPDPIPFTASPNDNTSYGPVIYQNAVNGDYGPISND